jgi:hypothetical protein
VKRSTAPPSAAGTRRAATFFARCGGDTAQHPSERSTYAATCGPRHSSDAGNRCAPHRPRPFSPRAGALQLVHERQLHGARVRRPRFGPLPRARGVRELSARSASTGQLVGGRHVTRAKNLTAVRPSARRSSPHEALSTGPRRPFATLHARRDAAVESGVRGPLQGGERARASVRPGDSDSCDAQILPSCGSIVRHQLSTWSTAHRPHVVSDCGRSFSSTTEGSTTDGAQRQGDRVSNSQI